MAEKMRADNGKSLCFPMTPESLIQMQENLMHRSATAGERGCMEAWASVFNGVYNGALHGDKEPYIAALNVITQMREHRDDTHPLVTFSKGAEQIALAAYTAGRMEADQTK